MEIENISDRVSIIWDNFNADVVVDGKVIKKFKNSELSYMNARRLAMDTVIKHTYL